MAQKAIIIGAGFGGLTAGLALQEAGWEVGLYERGMLLRPPGGGFVLWGGALTALQRLGLGSTLTERGRAVERLLIRDRRGRELAHADLPRPDAMAPGIAVRRSELHFALLGRFGAASVRMGAVYERCEESDRAVTAIFSDGSHVTADLLVGADGGGSRIRQALPHPHSVRKVARRAWVGITSLPESHPFCPPGALVEIWGKNGRFGAFRAGQDRLCWYFHTNDRAGMTERTRQPADKTGLLERFTDGWAAPIPALVSSTEENAIAELPIREGSPSCPRAIGRVALIGDAAYPSPPDLAQGASVAIEDALCLADRLASSGSVQGGLSAYDRARQARAEALERSSRVLRVFTTGLLWRAPILRDHAIGPALERWGGKFLREAGGI